MSTARVILFALLASLVGAPLSAEETALPPACRTDCVATFGTVLGHSPAGVEAYSNCNARCVLPRPNRLDGTYTGIQWQCVEYARRWLLARHGVVFGDVDVAADIWTRIDSVQRVADGAEFPLRAFLNGADSAPEVGDLLVYGRDYLRTGHVAIVTRRLADGVEVAEQNYLNQPWPADHARRVELIEHGGRWWLLDPYLIGWKRPELQP